MIMNIENVLFRLGFFEVWGIQDISIRFIGSCLGFDFLIELGWQRVGVRMRWNGGVGIIIFRRSILDDFYLR